MEMLVDCFGGEIDFRKKWGCLKMFEKNRCGQKSRWGTFGMFLFGRFFGEVMVFGIEFFLPYPTAVGEDIGWICGETLQQ